MRRRRRAPKEIAFSFDSFLDLVANVVGIILRLILVAWVGARSYKAIVPPPLPPPPALADPSPLPEPTDSRQELLGQRREEIDRRQDEVRQQDDRRLAAEDAARQLRLDLEALATQQGKLLVDQEAVEKAVGDRGKSASQVSMSLQEMQARSKKLTAELEKLRSLPRSRKQLRYRTPVSAPVVEEVMFECRYGRVALIDTGTFMAEIRREVRAKAEDLRSRWQMSELTSPVGAFRLRYLIERERGLLDGPAGAAPSDGTYRYGVTAWEVVPVTTERGEPAEQALTSGSAFRKVIDHLDPQQTAVTLWVYPDSFPLYRSLRDYLHGKELVVAGRPLPDGVPIASSRHGTTSRGQ